MSASPPRWFPLVRPAVWIVAAVLGLSFGWWVSSRRSDDKARIAHDIYAAKLVAADASVTLGKLHTYHRDRYRVEGDELKAAGDETAAAKRYAQAAEYDALAQGNAAEAERQQRELRDLADKWKDRWAELGMAWRQ